MYACVYQKTRILKQSKLEAIQMSINNETDIFKV